MKQLKYYFPESITGNGIFTEIAKIEWFDGLSPESFDRYFIMRAGDKIASNSLDFFVNDNGIVAGEKLTLLAKTIFDINKISWRNIYRDLTVEYNPIENTDYVETFTETGVSTGSAATESGGENSSTVNSDKFGFNSSVAVHDSVIGTNDTTSANTSTETSGNNTLDREIRKHGNIGVTTNADMIISDLEIWQNKIADRFIKDICDIIALSIY